MLPTADDLKKELMDIPPSKDKIEATRNFVTKIGNFMNKIQAGPLGKEGILKFNNEAMVQILLTQPPVTDQSWADTMSQAWLAGMLTAVITPGTVTNPVWAASGSKDVATIPAGAVTVLTAPIAAQLLGTMLKLATAKSNPPVPMATAFLAAAGACVFVCIGIAPPAVPTPIPFPGQ